MRSVTQELDCLKTPTATDGRSLLVLKVEHYDGKTLLLENPAVN